MAESQSAVIMGIHATTPTTMSVMTPTARMASLVITALTTLSGGAALAQQPVQPLPKLGFCPIGYQSSGAYCVPNASGSSRGAIEKVGNSCPIGFSSSGRYCLSNPSNNRQAIPRTGHSCPIGWSSSGRYCLSNH